jgi:hypothetical protein
LLDNSSKECKPFSQEEKVQFEPKAVAGIVEKHFPDWRRVLNELQRYSASGMIDGGILVNLSETNMKDLTTFLKEKDFQVYS